MSQKLPNSAQNDDGTDANANDLATQVNGTPQHPSRMQGGGLGTGGGSSGKSRKTHERMTGSGSATPGQK